MNVSEFLTARIADDEAWFQRATITGGAEGEAATFARRVLADCEAKRWVVAWAWDNEETLEGEWGDGRDRDELERAGVLPDPLRHLAAVYADHPDYSEDWRP